MLRWMSCAVALAMFVGGFISARGQDLFPQSPAQPTQAPPEETLPPPAPQASPAIKALDLPDNDMFGAGMGGRGGLGFGEGFGRIDGSGILASYRVAWLNSEAITGTTQHFESVREDWSIMVPIWRDGSDRLSFNVRVANTQIDTDIMVP